MALRVWLPLDGTLENKGCSDLTFSYSGSNIVVDNNGKIGKCYRRTTKASDAIISNKAINLGTNQSMFCWIKVDSFNSGASLTGILGQHRYSTNTGMGITLRYASASTGYASVNTGNGSSRTYNSYYGATVLNANTWYHIGYTYDGSNIRIYVNGNLDKTQAFTGMSCPADYIQVGAWSFTGSSGTGIDPYSTPEYINDVRIYDHCLSAAEVKEISQGLVLHYKLNDPVGFTDLIARGTSWNIYNNHNNTNMPSTLVATGGYYDGDKIYRETCTPTDNSLNSIKTTLHSHGVYNWGRTFAANTKYVFWIYYKPISHPDTVCGGTASNIGGWTEIPPVAVGGGWYRVGQYRNGTVTSDKTDSIFVSFKVPSATTGTPIIIDWASPHLLQGTTEIPPYDYPSTIIQDSGGYGHNGTINGTLTLSNDTPRYSNAIYGGNNTTSVVTTWDPSWLNSNQTFTCNVWINKKSQVGSDWNTIFRYANSNVKSQQLHFCYKASSILLSRYSDDISISYTIPTDQWIMLTWTGSGRSESLYINGEFKQTVTHSTDLALVSTAKLMLFKDAVRNNYGSDIMMSDFRIYCTALSADDILSLYHTAAKTDNLHNMHTFEYIENSPEIKLTKQGQFKEGEIQEDTVTKFYKTNKIIKAKQFIEK